MKSIYLIVRRTALIVLTAVLIGVSLPGDAPGTVQAAPSSALLAVPAHDWTKLFERYSGWIGADGIFSIPLDGNDAIGSAGGSTKTMFVFSDTLIGNVNASTLAATLTGFVNHSSAVLTGNTPSASAIHFVYGSGGDMTNTNLFGDSIWLNDGIAIGGTVYLTGFKYDSAWNATRLDLIGVPITGGSPDYASYWRIPNIAPFYRDANVIVMFGVGYLDNSAAAGAPNPDGYVYVYGCRNTLSTGVKDLVVARVPRNDFTDFSKWRYWNGSSWETNVTAALGASASLASEVSTELSVTPITSGVYSGKYMLVYTRNVGSNALEYRIADSPNGPFGAPVQFYTCEEPYIYAFETNSSTHCYNAKAHPHLSQPGELLISYNVNQTNGFLPSTNQIYRPRFVRLKLDAFGTVSDPRGTQVNVALGKSVTANTNGAAASRAVDGKWKDLDNDKWVALTKDASGHQWLRIDLGASYPISRWIVKHAGYANEPAVYNTRDFALQASADGTTWTTVDTVGGNTHKITDRVIPTTTARYFRLLIATPTQSTEEIARIYEVELYQTVSSAPGNLALYRPVRAGDNMFQAQRVTDGSWSSIDFDKWVGLSSGDKWIAIDLGDFYAVNRWVVRHAGAAGETTAYNTRDFKLQSSNDGLVWTDRDSVTGNTLNVTDRTVPGFTARYVRLYITNAGSDNIARIYEIEIYGDSP